MPTDADFLQAILADPDADAPRLAYADWLEEADDAARAEFIRVQCALAALPKGERKFHPLREREDALLDQHRAAWLRPVHDLFPPTAPRAGGWRRWFRRPEPGPIWHAGFRRGFVEVLGIDVDALLRRAGDLARIAPLRELILHVETTPDCTGTLESLVRCPHLSAVRKLSLTTHRLRPDEMRRLAVCPHLTGLRTLHLGCYGIDRAAVEVLVDAGLIGRLESLQVATFHASDLPWAEVLLESPAGRGLTKLLVKSFEGASDLVPRLTRTPPFSRLAELSLHDFRIGDRDLGAFLTWLPPTLAGLDLWTAGLGDRAAESLARAPRLRQFRHLSLGYNRITDIGALALADSPHLLASTRLDLEDNPISERVKNVLRIRLGQQVVV
jgi:uncharacterized protein (TIGR02996 family)